MEKEIIEYLTSFGMSKQNAEENVKQLIKSNELIEFYNNIQR